MGPHDAAWLIASPTTEASTFTNEDLLRAVRRRLRVAVVFDGPDPHGHAFLASGEGGRTDTRHKEVVAAWRQVLIEAGGAIPDRNAERMLSRTNIPVQPEDRRRLDLVVPCHNVAGSLPLFCDITVLSPIARNDTARPGTSKIGGRLLERAETENNSTYPEVNRSELGSLQCLGVAIFGRWGR